MGLGTGRRGMKSPPLVIAVLLACVFVLGINYWITSSRCVELQNHVMELESRMRRAAAERGAVEMKKNEYEDMLTKQKKQIDTIQSLHSSQLDNVRSQCESEKESLVTNITNKDNLLQNLQVQIVNLQKRLEESKLEVKELQESQTKKLSFELSQCSSKIAEVKEQCEERLRKAGVKGAIAANEDLEKAVAPKPEFFQLTLKEEVNMPKNDEKKEEPSKNNVQPKASPPSVDDKKAAMPPPPPPGNNEKNKIVEMNVEEKKPEQEVKGTDNTQKPGSQINPDNVDAEEQKYEPAEEDAEDQEANPENEEVDRDHLLNPDGQQEDDKDVKGNEQEENPDNMNDYNGDEANVAEPEAEKQAQLNDNKLNVKDDKPPSGMNKPAADQEAKKGHNQIL